MLQDVSVGKPEAGLQPTVRPLGVLGSKCGCRSLIRVLKQQNIVV